jgi:hypothetical protein
MKKLLFIFLLIGVVSLYAVSSSINSFRAFSNGTNITVEWSSSDESNIKQYEIQRSNNNAPYKKVKLFDAAGKANNYKFVDEDALLKQSSETPEVQSGKIYSYRIKLIYSNGNEELTEAISVTHQTNSIRRTWGMIKELFR